MVQHHGLGARPYDCSKCTLKFFFRTELDHHMLIFHQSDETTSLIENTRKMKNREPEESNHDIDIMVKKEVIQDGEEEEEEEEEEEVNVDDQVGQEEVHEKAGAEEQKLKMEVDSETASCKES